LITTLLALDPGIRGIGVAYFDSGVLRYANYLKNPVLEGDGPEAWFGMADAVYAELKSREMRVDAYACEYPQIYRVSKGDPNALIPLAAVSAACGAVLPIQKCVGFLPRQWKGQLKKEKHHPMILAALSEAERATILETRKTLVHNVIDAVGIGLFYLERSLNPVP
jgi:hypothetical protein